MYKYRAIWETIEKFEVIKETPKQVVFINVRGGQDRELKKTSYFSWHDTFAEAKQALIDKKQFEVDSIERRLKNAKEKLNIVCGLHEA